MTESPILGPLNREQQALARSAIGMVHRFARSFARQWPKTSEDDFCSVGNEAITVAARQFDRTLDIPFGAYAKKGIRGRMTDLATGQVFSQDAVFRAMRHAAEHAPELRESETDEENLSQLDAAACRVVTLARYRRRVAEWALGALSSVDSPEDPEALVIRHEERTRAKELIHSTLLTLSEPERTTVRRFFEDQATLDMIAADLGVSKRTVQRFLLRALDVLRVALHASGVESTRETP